MNLRIADLSLEGVTKLTARINVPSAPQRLGNP